ncbi:response regulator, partial [Bacteroides thetaiotaomicron]
TYKNPELNRYAYRLQNFDRDWQYTDADRRFAYYNNLPSGTYTFQLKATNENGEWSGYVRELTVVVLPPFWATWWAYLLYVIIVSVIGVSIYRTAKNRILLRNALRLREIEKAKAEELNHAKLQFFTNITHELLTPLTIISATVDELKTQAPSHNDLYTVMNSNIQRLIRLLQQILEFRKAETGNLKLRVSPGDIAAFVKNAAESFQPLVKKRKIHFSFLCDPESMIGYFDMDKLDKILYNLLSNAAKYNKEDGFIQVSLSYDETDKDFILLKIKDNGKGISKEKQKNLFKRFYEGDYRKFNTIGTGIGLSLTKDLVELHGGTISVESEVDHGTEFMVRIPIERSYYDEEQIDDEAISLMQNPVNYEDTQEDADVETQEVTIKANTILLVEDNGELLHLMTKLLSREYNVFTAQNGKEGIAVLEKEDVDLIVSDVMMPEMDGIEFCKYVKGHLEMSHIPMILLTAKNKEEDRAEAYEIGADAFISKPFNLTVLHARIRNLLKYKERMARDFKNQIVFEVKDLNYTSLDEDFIQRAIHCVNNHLEDPNFDQAQFADEMRTSKSTLYKKLKSLAGLNTSSFIRNVRLKAACRIMEEKGTNVRVSELAYAVGFNDPKYFSSCFKKEFDMLPSEYIERFIQNV